MFMPDDKIEINHCVQILIADMDLLPDEVIKLIIKLLPISGQLCWHHVAKRYKLAFFKQTKEQIMLDAINHGYLDIMLYFETVDYMIPTEICTLAARAGQLTVLQWARQQKYFWNELTCMQAAIGHLEVLQWARKQGCPWDEITCAVAAYGGYLEVLKWARKHGCPWTQATEQEAKKKWPLEFHDMECKQCNINLR
jgi:hypothetical protein